MILSSHLFMADPHISLDNLKVIMALLVFKATLQHIAFEGQVIPFSSCN